MAATQNFSIVDPHLDSIKGHVDRAGGVKPINDKTDSRELFEPNEHFEFLIAGACQKDRIPNSVVAVVSNFQNRHRSSRTGDVDPNSREVLGRNDRANQTVFAITVRDDMGCVGIAACVGIIDHLELGIDTDGPSPESNTSQNVRSPSSNSRFVVSEEIPTRTVESLYATSSFERRGHEMRTRGVYMSGCWI